MQDRKETPDPDRDATRNQAKQQEKARRGKLGPQVVIVMAKRIESNQWSTISAQKFFNCICHPVI